MREIKFRAWDKKKNELKKEFPLEDFDHWRSYPNDFIIMQFTGLKDKNGVDIYEGDILKCKLESDNSFWKGTINFFAGGFYSNLIPISMLSYKEVIGNIYRNPELEKEHVMGD